MVEEFKMEDFMSAEEETFSPLLDDIEIIDEEIDDKNNDDVDTGDDADGDDSDNNDDGNNKPPTQESDKNIKPASSSKTNIYSSLSKGLSEEGVFKFVKELDDVKDFDDFASKLDEEVEARIQERIKELTPEQQFFAAKRQLGYSDEDIMQQLQTKQGLDSITEDTLEEESESGDALRKNLIKQWYKSKGFSEAKIERDIKKIFDDGSDLEEAKEALSEIKTNFENYTKEVDKQRQEQIKEAQESRKKTLDNLKKFATETKEIIPGDIIPKKLRDEVFEGMTKPVSQTEDGTPLDIVGDFLHKGSIEDRFKLSYLIKVTNGLKDFSKLSTKKAKSAVIAELESTLKATDIKDFQSSGLDENFFAKLDGAAPVLD